MSKAILGTKLGMSQVFAENGDLVPVTVVEVLPNVVAGVKTVETDGYNAVQIGYGAVKEKHLTRPVKGQFEKAGIDPVKYLREYRLAEKPEYLGDFYKKNPLWYTPIKQIPFAMGWQGYTGNNGFRIWTKQRDIIGLVMRGSITPEEGVRQIVSATESLF